MNDEPSLDQRYSALAEGRNGLLSGKWFWKKEFVGTDTNNGWNKLRLF